MCTYDPPCPPQTFYIPVDFGQGDIWGSGDGITRGAEAGQNQDQNTFLALTRLIRRSDRSVSSESAGATIATYVPAYT